MTDLAKRLKLAASAAIDDLSPRDGKLAVQSLVVSELRVVAIDLDAGSERLRVAELLVGPRVTCGEG